MRSSFVDEMGVKPRPTLALADPDVVRPLVVSVGVAQLIAPEQVTGVCVPLPVKGGLSASLIDVDALTAVCAFASGAVRIDAAKPIAKKGSTT
jgi:hypothetical protein